MGPTIPIAIWVDEEKYRQPGESHTQKCGRIAGDLTDDKDHYRNFYDTLIDQRFLPGGRVQSSAGSFRQVTAFNCLAGDTLLPTLEYGLVPISEVAGEEVHVLDGAGKWVLSPINSFGVQEVVPVYLKGGYNGREKKTIKATLNHRWLLDNGEEKVTETLEVGDTLKFVKRSNFEDESLYRLGVQHGIIYGDGTKTRYGYQVRLCGSKNALLPYLDGQVSSPPSFEGDTLVRIRGDEVYVDLKALPQNSSAEYLTGFMRGWFATDGCVCARDSVAMLSCQIDGVEWLRKYGAIAGMEVAYTSKLEETTNYGPRNYSIYNVKFRKWTMTKEDFLLPKHKERFNEVDYKWTVTGVQDDAVEQEEVYCPRVTTTDSVQLDLGIHTGQCFVMRKVPDSLDGITDVLKEAAKTMQLGGGVGYDFSAIRPRNSRIRSLGSYASGPISFMGIFDAMCKTIASAGHRRGAQMACLRVDHPDIMEFITAKHNEHNLRNFNISVLVTDEFMEAVQEDKPFDLVFEGRVFDTVSAVHLWESILRSTYEWAEPGVIFIDRVNEMNNLWYMEDISATNPCGEQPLPPYGACLLGSINWTRYVKETDEGWVFDYDLLAHDVPHIVRAMDNVIDKTIYPLYEQEAEAKSKRRMGLGHTGVANALGRLGLSYGTQEARDFVETVMMTFAILVYTSSVSLAIEKGPFPAFRSDKYSQGKFIKRLPADLQADIAKYGIRNSHLLSIAPTGTISLYANNISSGIEPVFSHEFERLVQTADGSFKEKVQDYAYREWGIKCETADSISVSDHVSMLTTATKWVDSAVSKTCNVGDDVSWEDFMGIYQQAYEGGAKGCTTFRAAGKRGGILTASASEDVVEEDHPSDETITEEGGACFIDLETGLRSCGD